MQRTVKTFVCLTLSAAQADHHHGLNATAFGKQRSEKQATRKLNDNDFCCCQGTRRLSHEKNHFRALGGCIRAGCMMHRSQVQCKEIPD